MKRIVYIVVPIVISIFLGSIFMDVSRENDDIPVMSTSGNVKIFQTGIYHDKEEAEKEASLNKGVVISENESYSVYIGILKNEANITRMIGYLDEKNIYYFIKDTTIDPTFMDVLNKYEDLMQSSTSSVAFFQLNKKILERYQILYEN